MTTESQGVAAAFLALQNAIMAEADYDDAERVAMLRDVMRLKARILGARSGEEELPAEEPQPAGAAGEAQQVAPYGGTRKAIAEMQQQLRMLTIRQLAGELPIDAPTMQALLALPDEGALIVQLEAMRRARPRRYSAGPARSQPRAVGEAQSLPRPVPRLSAGATREDVLKFYRGE